MNLCFSFWSFLPHDGCQLSNACMFTRILTGYLFHILSGCFENMINWFHSLNCFFFFAFSLSSLYDGKPADNSGASKSLFFLLNFSGFLSNLGKIVRGKNIYSMIVIYIRLTLVSGFWYLCFKIKKKIIGRHV